MTRTALLGSRDADPGPDLIAGVHRSLGSFIDIYIGSNSIVILPAAPQVIIIDFFGVHFNFSFSSPLS
jgi:hypothetical protein